jgi:hypothetical protein
VGRKVRITLRVNSSGKAPADRRPGDLTLVIEDSEKLQ